MLSWLQSEGMILMKPIAGGTLPNKGRPNDLTRAYIGLIVFVINYNTYQNIESYKGRHKGRPNDELGQLEKEGEKECIKPFLSDSPKSDLLDFEIFYKAYPKHEARKKAFEAWGKLHPDHDLQQIILSAIEKQKLHKSGLKSRNEFCPEWPLPATWLNGKRWDDEVREEHPTHNLTPPLLQCPRCKRELVVKNDLYGDGCIRCEREMEARA